MGSGLEQTAAVTYSTAWSVRQDGSPRCETPKVVVQIFVASARHRRPPAHGFLRGVNDRGDIASFALRNSGAGGMAMAAGPVGRQKDRSERDDEKTAGPALTASDARDWSRGCRPVPSTWDGT